MHGVPVLGTLEEVAPLLASGQVTQVVVSTDSVQRERLDALQRLCADAGRTARLLVAIASQFARRRTACGG